MDRRSALIVLARTAGKCEASETLQGLRTVAFRPTVAPQSPRHLQIEIITNCNLGCVMCPRTVSLARAASLEQEREWQRRMPYERFLAVLDQFPGLQTVSLHGIGEPLMHPRLFEMVTAATQRGGQVRFTTNATLLDRARCERLILSGLHRLIVSLDGATTATYEAIRPGAKLEKVLENLRTLTDLRREACAVQPRIEVAMVVQALNAAEVPDLVALAHKLGVDGVILSPMQPPEPDMADLACDAETWRRAVTAARARSRQLGIPLYVRGGPAHPRRGLKPTWRCMHPWFSAVVTLDGNVMPCCNIHDPALSMGNGFTESFPAVWNGPRYRGFRRELRRKGHVPEPCRWCPDF